ncbi:hypothetical protein, partial [Salmonella enterica]|uniref:hypothetical protein n=1 Tax=Salmonella enterica TaxID=28901 RepID=UPI003CEE8C31
PAGLLLQHLCVFLRILYQLFCPLAGLLFQPPEGKGFLQGVALNQHTTERRPGKSVYRDISGHVVKQVKALTDPQAGMAAHI